MIDVTKEHTASNTTKSETIRSKDNHGTHECVCSNLDLKYRIFVEQEGKENPAKVMKPLLNMSARLLTAIANVNCRLEALSVDTATYLSKSALTKKLIEQLSKLIALHNSILPYSESGPEQFRTSQTDDLCCISYTSADTAFLTKVKDQIQLHMEDVGFGVVPLARQMAMSSSKLGRKLSALTGQSPVRYIRTWKLSNARKMLKNPHLNISEIAFQSGFSDPSYFGRVFYREYGMSARTYRRHLNS